MNTPAEEIRILQDTLRKAIKAHMAREGISQREFAARIGCTVPTLDTFLRGSRNWELKTIGRALGAINMPLSELAASGTHEAPDDDLAKYQARLRLVRQYAAPGLWDVVTHTIDTWYGQLPPREPAAGDLRLSVQRRTGFPACPKCYLADRVHPSRRRGLDWLLAPLLITPFRCWECDARFHRFGIFKRSLDAGPDSPIHRAGEQISAKVSDMENR